MLLSTLFFTWLLVATFMILVWLFYYWQKTPGVVDVAWSLAIALASSLFLCQSATQLTAIHRLWATLLFLWAFRLAGYLWITRIRPKQVDKRYIALQQSSTYSDLTYFFWNYQLQGLLALIIATPFWFIGHLTSLTCWQWLALSVTFIGIMGESLADAQLYYFKQRHPDAICQQGLWRYSRHPNCFFDALIWIGFSLGGIGGTALGWLSLLSPLCLLWIMLTITIPITEANSLKHRGNAFIQYQKTTARFLPWFRR